MFQQAAVGMQNLEHPTEPGGLRVIYTLQSQRWLHNHCCPALFWLFGVVRPCAELGEGVTASLGPQQHTVCVEVPV